MMAGHRRLDTMIDDACVRFPDRVALTDDTTTLTYAELAASADHVRSELAAAGHLAGDPVLVAVGNRCEDAVVHLSVWRAEGIVVPVHHGVPDAVVRQTAIRTGARLLLSAPARRPTTWTCVTPGTAGAWAMPVKDDVADMSVVAAPTGLDAQQALVIFTSGSTGQPKGVVLSHAAFTAKLGAIAEVLPFGLGEQSLQVLQFTSSFGQWVAWLTIAAGGTIELLPRFDSQSVLDRLGRRHIDHVAAVPSMLRMLVRELESAGLGRSLHRRLEMHSSPGVWISGGESLPASFGRRLRALLPASGIADVFGLSETSTSDFILTPDRYDAEAGTIGRPTPGVEFRLAPTCEREEHGDAESGELWLRTPYLMTGYLGDPRGTESSVTDGWFRTGDLARRRVGDQLVELIGRHKQMIVRGGVKISPLEVETAYAAHPANGGCVAVGVPDHMLGERVHLAFLPTTDPAPTEVELRTYGRERLERHKVPDRVHLVTDLPLGRTGKSDRQAVARMAAEAGRATTSPPAVPAVKEAG